MTAINPRTIWNAYHYAKTTETFVSAMTESRYSKAALKALRMTLLMIEVDAKRFKIDLKAAAPSENLVDIDPIVVKVSEVEGAPAPRASAKVTEKVQQELSLGKKATKKSKSGKKRRR